MSNLRIPLSSELTDSRENWITSFQTLLSNPPDEMNDEWALLLKSLGLPLVCYLAVLEVLKQGRWAKAECPRAYVKYASKIEARKMGLLAADGNDTREFEDKRLEFMDANDLDDYIPQERDPFIEHTSERELLREQSMWVMHEPSKTYLRAIEKINRSINEYHIHPSVKSGPDWDKWAHKAGFDSWEREVLRYRICGISRDIALAEQPDEFSFKALQAAWKRFDRTGKLKLRECLKK